MLALSDLHAVRNKARLARQRISYHALGQAYSSIANYVACFFSRHCVVVIACGLCCAPVGPPSHMSQCIRAYALQLWLRFPARSSSIACPCCSVTPMSPCVHQRAERIELEHA